MEWNIDFITREDFNRGMRTILMKDKKCDISAIRPPIICTLWHTAI